MGDANIPACPQSNQLRGQNHDYHVIVTAMALKSFVVGLLTCQLAIPSVQRKLKCATRCSQSAFYKIHGQEIIFLLVLSYDCSSDPETMPS